MGIHDGQSVQRMDLRFLMQAHSCSHHGFIPCCFEIWSPALSSLTIRSLLRVVVLSLCYHAEAEFRGRPSVCHRWWAHLSPVTWLPRPGSQARRKESRTPALPVHEVLPSSLIISKFQQSGTKFKAQCHVWKNRKKRAKETLPLIMWLKINHCLTIWGWGVSRHLASHLRITLLPEVQSCLHQIILFLEIVSYSAACFSLTVY